MADVGFLMRIGPPPEMGPGVTIEHVRNWIAFDHAPVREVGDQESKPGVHHLMVWAKGLG